MTGGASNISLWVRSVKGRDRELSGIGGSFTPILSGSHEKATPHPTTPRSGFGDRRLRKRSFR